jgi:hypothetical protein
MAPKVTSKCVNLKCLVWESQLIFGNAIHSCGLWDTYGVITRCERDVKRICHVGFQA